jgi:hypothetical protein
MRHDEFRRLTTCNTCTLLVPFVILNLLAFLPSATAQVVFSESSALNTPRPFVTMPPTTDSRPELTSIVSSQLAPLDPLNSSQPPLKTPALFIAAEQPQQQVQVSNRVFNYYFLFLALLVAVVAVLLWYIHRHRKRGQEQVRLRGRHALVHDVEQAILRRNQPPFVEGLNESGEAPPPYKPKDNKKTIIEAAGNNGITIPPRVLSRDGTEHVRLPGYAELIRANGREGVTANAGAPNQIGIARGCGNTT